MKRIFILWCLAAGFSAGQESGTIDLEARRQSVATLKQHLEMREARLAEVSAQIRERGEATDRKIGKLVDLLAGLKDSQSSKRRISEVKSEVIAGLMKMLEVYKRERNDIVRKIRGDDNAPAKDLMKDMRIIDQLAEKRVAQILDLVKSIPGGKDVAKYESDGGVDYHGVYYENSRISEEWRQNRRDRVRSEKQRSEAQEALRKAIAELDRRRDALKEQVARNNLNDTEKELFEQELAHVSALIDARKLQLLEVSAPSDPGVRAASRGEADDLEDLLNDARRNIAEDFAQTVRLYHAAAGEREKIHAVKENLAAREKWLRENDPEAGKSE